MFLLILSKGWEAKSNDTAGQSCIKYLLLSSQLIYRGKQRPACEPTAWSETSKKFLVKCGFPEISFLVFAIWPNYNDVKWIWIFHKLNQNVQTYEQLSLNSKWRQAVKEHFIYG